MGDAQRSCNAIKGSFRACLHLVLGRQRRHLHSAEIIASQVFVLHGVRAYTFNSTLST